MYDNAPGLTTLALIDDEGDSSFYCDVTPHNVPITTPDYEGILKRLIGVGHDFAGASSYPLQTVLNVACARCVCVCVCVLVQEKECFKVCVVMDQESFKLITNLN